ncbi:MAG: efflux RND transporter permease subunit [Candidatus Omnitrophica bacterium]|nr:efflux RND transporter permease subunit [Candidatus Omnitrophota bacterium]
MKIAEFSVKNSTLVNLISFLIIFIGIFSMYNLRKEAFPSVDYDMVTVTTSYPGAPANDVEKLVTIPIEKEIKGISGIKEINAISEESVSTIGIEIDSKTTDKKQVVDDIERAVARVQNLPEGVKDDPYVFEIKSKEIPVLEISISGDIPDVKRREYGENLEDLILDVYGVASIRRMGWLDPQFQVEVNPQKLKEYHVSINEIINALKAKNITLPGGHLTTEQEEFNVRTTGEFNTIEEIQEVVVRSNDMGNHLKVHDIANVVKTFEDEESIARTNGKRTLGMVVIKSEGADIVKVVKKVNDAIDQFKQILPKGVDVTTANDMSFYVKRRLGVLRTNGFIGFFLVVVVLFLFLDPVPALMTAMGIPIALFTTFFCMHIFGVTVNLVSMLGLIIVLGMIVDDGIIVSENVYRYVESGMSPREAAIKGTNEVVAPITAAVLTTCAAFAPLLFIPDIMGKFIRQIPIVVMIALGASLLEAFIILPSHLAEFVKGQEFKKHVSEKRKEKKWFEKINNFYLRILKFTLKNRYVVLGSVVIFCVFVIAFAANTMKVVLFTGEGIEDFYIRAEAKVGTPLKKMEELILPVEQLIETIDASERDSYRTYIGEISNERGFDPNSKKGSYFAQLTVFLTPAQERQRTQKEIINFLRPKLEKIQGFDKLYFYAQKEGPPTGRAIELGVKGDDLEVLEAISNKIVKFLENVKGASDVSSNYVFGKKDLRVIVDEEKANKYFLNVNDIALTVRSTFYGGKATAVKPLKAEDEIDVLVRFPQEYRNDINVFDDILIENKRGSLVPLKSVASIKEKEGLFSIAHLDGKRVVWITGDVDGKNATSFSVNELLKKEFSNIENEYPGYFLKFGGEYEEQKETQANLLFSLVVALFLIFIILTAVFGSLLQPFIVMTAIPFGIVGVLLVFMAHGRPLTFLALMGSVGLTGIVVNDSVVLVDFINKLRKAGNDRRESLIEAGRVRLRPVLMTTITTIAGLVSVAYGIGGGDPFLKPMGLALIWGLFFATGLTLIMVPCIYAIVDDFSEKVFHHATIKVNGDMAQ